MILLTAFKFSGLSNGPLTLAQTTTQEPIRWGSERPFWFFHFGQEINASFSGGGSINASVFLDEFSPNMFLGSDVLTMGLNVTVGLIEGYVQNVTLTIQDDYLASWVQINDIESGSPSRVVNWENLSLTSYREGLGGRGNVEKTSMVFLSENHPRRASVCVWPWWLLESSGNETQQLAIRFETTYFNGTVYEKVVQPFLLKLAGDSENTYETAREVAVNETVTDFIGGDDRLDFFKMNLRKGETLNVTIPPGRGTWEIIFYLYGPNDETFPLANSSILTSVDPMAQSIVLRIDPAGWYYVKIECIAGIGPYSMMLAAS
jgi:hypothetical protein